MLIYGSIKSNLNLLILVYFQCNNITYLVIKHLKIKRNNIEFNLYLQTPFFCKT